MNNIFVSVIMSCFNESEEELKESIDSILNQSYRNFELVIVDCASSDNTVSEIERFFSSSDYKNHPQYLSNIF